MSYKKLFWGMILIVVGTLFILRNLGILWFSWRDIWQFWPIFIIIWGVSLLPIKALYRLLFSLAAIVFGIILIHQYGSRESVFKWRDNGAYFNYHNDDDDDIEDKAYLNSGENKGSLHESMNEEIDYAELNLEVGAGEFDLIGTSDKLIICEFTKKDLYQLSSKTINNRAIVNLEMKDMEWKGREINNDVIIRMNQSPEWTLDMDVGAADLNMDLRPFNVRKISLDGGASAVELTLGERADKVNIEIDAGAASITLHIPKDTGCELNTESFMIGKSLEGFEKISKGYYKTKNFNTSEKKIYVDLEAAISSFNVDRY